MRGLETISIPSHVLAAWVWSALAVPLLDLGRAGIAKRFYKVMGHFICIYIFTSLEFYIQDYVVLAGVLACVCVLYVYKSPMQVPSRNPHFTKNQIGVEA